MNRNLSLWKQTGKNTILSVLLFAALFGLLYLVEHFYPELQLLRFYDAAFCVGIPASITGVAYVLSIKNPENYTGFYAGIVMSLLLCVQFFLQGNYDLCLLYIAIFVPFQIKSIVQWVKPHSADAPFAPEFLSKKAMWISVAVCMAVTVLDYLFATYVVHSDGLLHNWLLKLMGALMISSSVLANFWLIYKKNDAWIYWVIYSLSGIIFYVILNNAFSVVVFVVFGVINGMAGIAWIRNTDEEHMGWLRR